MATLRMALASSINQLHDTEPRWFAVHTRAKSEKMVWRQLDKKGVHAYVPLQRLLRRYAKSERWVEKPLIHGYVFVCITRAAYVAVLETEHVSGFVKFNKNLIAIPESEINVLRRITLEEGLILEAIPGSLDAGDSVEVNAGSLTGLRGRVIRGDGRHRFQVELENLGYSLLITVDAAFLQKTTRYE